MLTELDYRLSAAKAAHAHLVCLRRKLTQELVLLWLRKNPKHPKALAIDTMITLHRLHGNLQNLHDADDFVTTDIERTTP